ncbi:GNAT family N-acetyltransferase [Streptomyces sp. RB6PN25]|uniref:GNAT family N-acetyltransferase n=1 Tax=Streptomyces humicola TaxID=2953240 RepID=A0ABT1PSU0_9ACTN|nr:GNAT family N-acetyltransferase [Streptomyces humicola]MCQ4080746.1 GNAT family N-acetyltransferase [Streptomyces humicola]
MLIRAAQSTEAEILSELALRSRAYWDYDEAFMAACRDELTVPASKVESLRTAVAEQDGGRILSFSTLEGSPPEGVLGMLFVEPDTIGRGISRRLFEHVIATAHSLGFTRLSIDADPNAEPFYLAMGAARIGTTPSGSIPARTLPLLTVIITERTVNNETAFR